MFINSSKEENMETNRFLITNNVPTKDELSDVVLLRQPFQSSMFQDFKIEDLLLKASNLKNSAELEEYRRRINKCAKNINCNVFQENEHFVKAASTQYGEIITLDKDWRIRLMSESPLSLETTKRKDFFYVKSWKATPKSDEMLEQNAQVSSINNHGEKLARRQETFNDAVGDEEFIEDVLKIKTIYDLRSEYEDKFSEVCECSKRMQNGKGQIRVFRSFYTFRLTDHLVETNSDPKNVAKDVSQLQYVTPSQFCFNHEMIVSWNNRQILFHNLADGSKTTVTLNKVNITFVALDDFPVVLFYDAGKKTFFRYDIVANKYVLQREVKVNDFKPYFLKYSPITNLAVLHSFKDYMVITPTKIYGPIMGIGNNINVRSSGQEIYYSSKYEVFGLDPLSNQRRLIASFDHLVYEMFLSSDDKFLYLTLADTTASDNQTKYTVCKLHIESGKIFLKLNMKSVKPQNIFVNADHSLLMFNTTEKEVRKTVALQLSSYSISLEAIYNGYIAGISDDCSILYLGSVNDKLYAQPMSEGGVPELYYQGLRPFSTVCGLAGKLFINAFDDERNTGFFDSLGMNNLTEILKERLNDLFTNSMLNENQASANAISKVNKSSVTISNYLKKKNRINLSVLDFSTDLRKYIVYENLANLMFLVSEDFSFERQDVFSPKLNNVISGSFIDFGNSFLVQNKVGLLELWNTQSRKRVKMIAKDVMAFTASNTLRLIFYLASDGNLVIYDFDAFEIVHSFSFINDQIPNDKWPLFSLRVNEYSKKLYIAYKSSLFSVDLTPRITFPEKEYILSFFPKEKNMMNNEEFSLLLTEFAHVYLDSPILRTYLNPYFIAGCYYLGRCVASLPKDLVLTRVMPRNPGGQFSALELAVLTKNLSLLNIICERYIKYEKHLVLSQSELRLLLKLDMYIAKQLLASRFKKIDRRNLVSMISGQPDFKQMLVNQTYSEFSEYALNVLFEERNSKSKKNANEQSQTGVSSFQNVLANESNKGNDVTNFQSKSKLKNDVDSMDFFMIEIKSNFKTGSEDSLEFFQSYSECQFDDFVLSNWRCLIEIKWKNLRYYYWIYSLILTVTTVLLTLMAYYFKELIIVIPCMFLLLILLLYEIASILFYPRYYFRQGENYIDLMFLILGIILVPIIHSCERYYINKDGYRYDYGYFSTYWIETQGEKPGNYSSIDIDSFFFFFVICLIFAYLRTLLAFKIFPIFRSLIAMLWAVTINVIDIILLYAIIIIMFATVYNISEAEGKYSENLEKVFSAILGDLKNENVKFADTWILQVLIGIIVTLIMANFMIARISNTYSDLEKSQRAVNYRQMANTLWEIEICIRKVKTLFARFQKAPSVDNFDPCYQLLSCNREDDIKTYSGPDTRKEIEDIVAEYQMKVSQNNVSDMSRTKSGTLSRQSSLVSVNSDVHKMNQIPASKREILKVDDISSNRNLFW